jgi:phosphoribosylanthranilate isomerase
MALEDVIERSANQGLKLPFVQHGHDRVDSQFVEMFPHQFQAEAVERRNLSGVQQCELLGKVLRRAPIRQFGFKAIKAFRVRNEDSLRQMTSYQSEAWLLDSYVPGRLGGTGAQFNWQFAIEAAKLNRMIILAGGLTPDNVAEAVREVRPYGVDVSSGVESAPGKKDRAKVRAFVQAARGEG